jgi:glutathione S-transferase
MHLYNSIAPNPRAVRIFMAEKGIDLPKVEGDIHDGENRKGPYLAKNPSGRCPALALDNGMILAEITAICEYLDEMQNSMHAHRSHDVLKRCMGGSRCAQITLRWRKSLTSSAE